MQTRLTEQFGIEYPIFAFTHCRDVVAAVTNAGGFGVLGSIRKTPEELEADLVWIDEHVGDRPYGVDILLPQTPLLQMDAEISERQSAFVDDLLRRYEVPGLAPHIKAEFDADRVRKLSESHVEVAFQHPIRLIASALGSPSAELIAEAHSRDVVVAALAGSPVHAERHQAAGVDIVVAQGTEAGGHTGDIATMVLTPEVVDRIAPTPVLAAGGIARGRQVAAALALGAEGVWTGSVWLTTIEADTEPQVRRKLLAATSRDTVRTRVYTGKPCRVLRSSWTEAWEEGDAPAVPAFGAFRALTDEPLERIKRGAADPESGAYELLTYPAGQVVGQIDQERSARQVLFDMVEEYAEVAQTFAKQLEG